MREAGYSRAGYHSKNSGRFVDAHQWVIASFPQHTSRDNDPHLHVHNAILNRVLREDLLASRPGGPARRHPADSGYAHRDADAWAIPLRQAGAQLVQDLHLHDRGAKGTCQGAIIVRPGQAITFDVVSPDRGGSRTVVCSLSTSANVSAGALVGGHGVFSMRVARWNAVAISLA